MAAGGNSPCPAQEPVSAYTATSFLNLTHDQKVVRLFAHFPTVVKPARRPVKKNGYKNRKISIISLVQKMSRESGSGVRKIPDIQKGLQ
jgi:uncharacterized membrane protein YvbJ